jgi:hypothetical protein
MTWTPAISLQGRDCINQRKGLLRVVTIGPGKLNDQRNSSPVANQMTLAAELYPVGGVGTRLKPPKPLLRNYRPRPPVTNQSARSALASLARRSESVARCPPLASRAIFASSSSPNHTSSPAAASAKESRCAERTRHLRGKRDRTGVVFHLEVCVSGVEEVVRSDSTRRRKEGAWPWKLHLSKQRSSKLPRSLQQNGFCYSLLGGRVEVRLQTSDFKPWPSVVKRWRNAQRSVPLVTLANE